MNSQGMYVGYFAFKGLVLVAVGLVGSPGESTTFMMAGLTSLFVASIWGGIAAATE